MARDEAPPFGRGEYDTTSGAFDHLLGKQWEFEDLDYTASNNVGAKPHRTARSVRCRLVKNSAGVALLPKALVQFSTSGTDFGAVVTGKARLTAGHCFPVDEFLPAAGVPDGAYFWVVTGGPAMCITPLDGAEFNGEITVGSVLVSLTAATSGATTAGRLAVQNTTASTQTADYSFLANLAQNWVGRALSARTTGNTNADVLVDLVRR